MSEQQTQEISSGVRELINPLYTAPTYTDAVSTAGGKILSMEKTDALKIQIDLTQLASLNEEDLHNVWTGTFGDSLLYNLSIPPQIAEAYRMAVESEDIGDKLSNISLVRLTLTQFTKDLLLFFSKFEVRHEP